ncbi:GYD domain protein (plasmid) [Ensifer sp. WSM1721]
MITLAPKVLSQVCASIQGIHAVKTLHSVSGTFDLIAVVEAPSIFRA